MLEDQKEYAPTCCPALNVALSGKFNGGLTSGITMLAGPSKNGKTLLGLVLSKAYLDKWPDACLVFLDSEAGSNAAYFDTFGIDKSRVIHIPVTNIEEIKFQTVNVLEELARGEKACFFFDSLGNTASKKELDDALSNVSKADMSRAKAIKSYFRIITPLLARKNIPFVCVNHTYSTQDMFPVDVMSGGQGPLLSANTVFFMGKAKEKDGKELSGFAFKVKVYKSRCIREGSVFSVLLDFERGIDTQSDLFDAALEGGFIVKSSNVSYMKNEKYGDQKKYRKADFMYKEPDGLEWFDILNDEEFILYYEGKFSFGQPSEVIESDTTEEEND
jgi:RecA/RadA recombinase